jgi:excisionase family DNA binding protein
MTSKIPKRAHESAAPNPASATAGGSARRRPLTKFLTIDETADLFNVSTRTVRRFIDSGALPAHRLGRLVRISEDDIAVFLAATRDF